MAEKLPVAEVLHWDAHNVYVRCPFCDGKHRHGMNAGFTSGNKRVAHCPPVKCLPDSYEIRFPIDEATGRAAYWIHKKSKRFFAASEEPEPEEDAGLAEALESQLDFSNVDDGPCILLESATEEEAISLKDEGTGEIDSISLKIIDKMVSLSIYGKLEEVSRYLEESAEPEVLIFGKDENGSTVLSMIAAERHPRMVSLFLDKGARVNTCNDNGRTPLMEAALWGRAENVEILLAGGADTEMKDREGRKAIDFTTEKRENKEERYIRSSREHQIYRENTYNADRQRKAIERMLDIQREISTPTQDLAGLQVSTLEFHSFHSSPKTSEIILSGPIATFPVRSLWKTIARLEHGNGFPAVDAMSGWGHHDEQNITISGKSWTDEVFAICRVVGHPLHSDAYDGRARPGSWNACHAEKHLVAYFINRHVFLPNEIATKHQVEEERGKHNARAEMIVAEYFKKCEDINQKEETSLQELCDVKGREDINQKEENSLRDLFDGRPPVALKRATILVSREICSDCRKFVQRVEEVLGLSFHLKTC